MTNDTAQVQADLASAVSGLIRNGLPEDRAELAEQFTQQYLRWVPAEDLAEREPPDLAGAVHAHLKLAQRRASDETKLRLGTPERERDGWKSPHTVLEIVTDDMPFLIDSVVMELSRNGYGIHLVIHPVIRVTRDSSGTLIALAPAGERLPGDRAESVIHVEFDREPEPERLAALQGDLERVLGDVRAAVEDWRPMRALALKLADELDSGPISEHELHEARAFLRWLTEERFVFLGYRSYRLVQEGDGARLDAIPET
ncbi:MAG: NAD-glutamate dehydrogenase, partial [Solirubrobacteraceae bacterium]